VTNSKAVSVAFGSNWFLLILISFTAGPLFSHETFGPYGFTIFSGINAAALLILFLFMKETKDLSEK
jgi:hypothetical protein